MLWKKLLRKQKAIAATIPDGEVVYAIGDVHGRLDLLDNLVQQIDADAAAAPELKPTLVMLGDYIDRGDNSRGVIDRLIRRSSMNEACFIALKGNHEAALLDFLEDPASGPAWCDHGGRQTLLSYGVMSPRGREPGAWQEARDAFAAVLPEEHLQFVRGLKLYHSIGGYIFVHAGLRPKTPLVEQAEQDILWIRSDFLNAAPWMDQIVVHGHTPSDRPSGGPARIGIDTGAYATGVLTAVRLESGQRRYLQTGAG